MTVSELISILKCHYPHNEVLILIQNNTENEDCYMPISNLVIANDKRTIIVPEEKLHKV